MRLIAIAGLKRSGKDTAGEVLISEYGFTKMAFADPIKTMLAAGLDLDHEQLHGNSKEVELDWLPGVTPRELMNTLGTEWGQHIVRRTLWSDLLHRRLQKMRHGLARRSVVVTDTRFEHEAEMLRQNNAVFIHIRRGKQSLWARLKRRFAHSSERGLKVRKGDFIVQNSGSKRDLWDKVESILLGTWASMDGVKQHGG